MLPTLELIERDEPLAQLGSRVAALVKPGAAGGCVLVEGEAGIGKTSLLRATEAHARRAAPDEAEAPRWLWGSCEPLLAPPALGPLLDMLSALPPAVAGAVQSGYGLNAVLSGMLAWLQSGLPRVLVIEDVQWADSATLDLLRYLSRRIDGTQALLVMTCRDDAVSAELRQVLAGLPARTTLRLALPALSRDAVERLASRAGQGAASAQQLYGASRGNPFFVSELLASGPQDSARQVPASVREAVLARVALLPPPARELSEWLSVMPSPPATQELLAAWPDALEAAAAALHAGLLEHSGEVIGFRHEIARQAVEASLPPERARALHRRVLAQLEHAGASAAHRVHHAERAGQVADVLRLVPEAAREAAEASAHHQAAALYALALEHRLSLPPAQRAAVFEAHAAECMLVNRIDAAIESRRQALQLRRELGDERGQGINLRMLARLQWLQGGPQSAVPLAREALPLLQRAGDQRELAMAYATLAQLQLLGPSSRPALDWGLHALRLAEEAGDAEALSFTLNTVACAELRSGDAPLSWARLERSLALALEHGLEEHAARAYANLPSVGLVQRRLPQVLRWCAEGIAYCEARDLDMYVVRLRIRRAYVRLEEGAWEAAAQELEPLQRLSASTPLEREQSLHVRMLIALRRGEEQVTLGETAHDAATYWREMKSGGRALSVDPWYSPQSVARAEACWLAGESDALVQIATAALPAAIEAEEPWRTGQLACWLARCGALPTGFGERVAPPCAAELAGDHAGAAALWAALGCRYEQASALAAGGAAELREALLLLDALGAVPAAARARARLRALGVREGSRGPYRGARADPLGLTPRERQILELLRRRLSNRAIAEQLHRSERTVEAHVSALLAKLGVAGREEAVARAAAADSQNPVPHEAKPRTRH